MRIVLWLSALISVGLYIAGPLVDPDLWWHITAGRWMIAHGEVPTVDYWNMFGVGKPWRAYSWSVEVVFAAVEGNFGIPGLLLLKFLLGVSIALVFGWVLGRIAGDHMLGGLLGLFVTAACFNHFTLRPQSLTWIYFALLVLYAVRIEREGVSRSALVAIGCVMMCWANTHLASILGLVVLVLWVAASGEISRVVKAGGAGFLGTLFTPYLGGEWITFFSKTGHPFRYNTIAEFQPATIMQYTTAFALMLAAVVLLLSVKAFHPKLRIKLALCLCFLGAGLAVVKFLPYAIIMNAAVIADIWYLAGDNKARLGNLGVALMKVVALVGNAPKEGLSFVLICFGVVNAVSAWKSPIAIDYVPVKAVDFIMNKALPTPILNTFGDGGYVMYRLSDERGTPRALVPIDGRTNVNPDEVMRKQQSAARGTENWRSYFSLVKPETVLWRRESPLSTILRLDNEWCEVYRDGAADKGYTVFVKRAFTQAKGELLPDGCLSDPRS